MSVAALRSALAGCLSAGALDLVALNVVVLPEVHHVKEPVIEAPTVLSAPREWLLTPQAVVAPPVIESQARAIPVAILEFSTSSRRVGGHALHTLEATLEGLRHAPHITVVGHADAAGSVAFNERLSQQRAEAVARALIRAGILKTRIDVLWRGAREPRSDGDSKRVELYLGEAP